MGITILHLSDIQYGRHHVDKDQERDPLYRNEDYSIQLEKIIHDLRILKGEHGVCPNFIVATGDIAEHSLREEYLLAEEFLGGIAEFLHIDRRYVVIVPGNHDVNRKLCQSSRLRFEAENKIFKPPYFAKFEFFQEFFHRFYKDVKFPKGLDPYQFTEDRLFVNFHFLEESISFVGLNSCVDENEQGPHYGNITIHQLRKAVEDLNQFDSGKKMMRIALMHHNFIRSSSNDEENLIDADELKPMLIEAGFNLILHGHQHIPRDEITGKGTKHINVLATGSAGLDAKAIPENNRRYQIIDIKNNHVKVYRRLFDNVMINTTGKGCWKPDLGPSQNDIFDEFALSGIDSKTKREKIDNPVIVSTEGLRILYDYTHPDAYPCPKVKIADLDWELVEKYSKKVRPDLLETDSEKHEIVDQLGFFSVIPFQGEKTFHRSAVLCFSQRPDRFNLELKTQSCSWFYVGNPGDPEIITKEVYGPLSSQIAQLNNLAMQYLGTISYRGSKNGERREVDEIDRDIIRELVSNAITHRDYNLPGTVQVSITPDAFEVRNPGRFPKGTSWSKFIDKIPVSVPINLGIAHYLKELLVFEGIGQGFNVIRNYLENYGKDSIACVQLPGPTMCVRVFRRRNPIKERPDLSVVRDPHWQLKLDRVQQFGTVFFLTHEMLNKREPKILVFLWYGEEGQGVDLFHHRLKLELRDTLREVNFVEIVPEWPGGIAEPDRSYEDMLLNAFGTENMNHITRRIRPQDVTNQQTLVYIRHRSLRSVRTMSPQMLKHYFEWLDTNLAPRLERNDHIVVGISFVVKTPSKFYQMVEKKIIEQLTLRRTTVRLLEEMGRIVKKDLIDFLRPHNIAIPQGRIEDILDEIMEKTGGKYDFTLEELKRVIDRSNNFSKEETYEEEDDDVEFGVDD